MRKSLLGLRARPRRGTELVGSRSTAMEVAAAAPPSLSLHRDRAPRLATRPLQRAATPRDRERGARIFAPAFFTAALFLVGCTAEAPGSRTYLKDAAGGELPLVALWTEPAGAPLLAVWSNGDAVWKPELRPSMEPLKTGLLSKADVERIVSDIESSLARFEDKPTDPALMEASSMVLGFRRGERTWWVTTYHTMMPDLPTVLCSRWTRMLVEDPGRRAELESRIPANQRECVVAWDRVMASLSATLAASTGSSERPREIVWTPLPSQR